MAVDGHWQPAGIDRVQTPLGTVLARIDAYRGAVSADYVEGLRVVAGGATLRTVAKVSGNDCRYATTVGAAVYASGRVNGTRWRQTPAGLVRTLASDLQGDALDRWPASTFAIASNSVALIGQTRGPRPEWVVQDASALGTTHWFYVDQTSGAIERELTREGSVTYTFTFDDVRDTAGTRRPFHWQISGFGGPADVTVENFVAQAVAPGDIALPVSVPAAPPERPVRLPASFVNDRITVAVRVNGRSGNFLLDTGTTQILAAASSARRFGVSTLLDHGLARELDIGERHLRDVPIMTVSDLFRLDGILGYDFFAGSIVHIDFAQKIVEVEPRAGFVPSDTARALNVTFDEGLPLAEAAVGPLDGKRFALDTGSAELVFPRYLWEQRGLSPLNAGFRELRQPPRTDTFLEGAIVTAASTAPDLAFGGVRFTSVEALVERPNAGATIDIPFDGILGTNVLDHFEWWFDYSGGRAWVASVPALPAAARLR